MSLLQNICKYEQCGKIFPSLGKLIAHIESTHINFNPQVVEFLENEMPAALPLSYVLPSGMVKPRSGKVLKSQLQHVIPSRIACTETADEAETEAENEEECGDGEDCADNEGGSLCGGLDSDEDLIAEFIMRYGRKPIGNELEEKPYACPVPGCMKRYKNANGIKYHSKHGHRKNSKPYECYCGKGYKTNQGLKNHMTITHNAAMSMDVVTTPETTISSPPDLSSSLETLNITTLETLPSSFDELCQIDQGFNQYAVQAKQDCKQIIEEPDCILRSDSPSVSTVDVPPLEPYAQSFWDGVVNMPLPFEETEQVLEQAFASMEDIIDVGDVNDSMF